MIDELDDLRADGEEDIKGSEQLLNLQNQCANLIEARKAVLSNGRNSRRLRLLNVKTSSKLTERQIANLDLKFRRVLRISLRSIFQILRSLRHRLIKMLWQNKLRQADHALRRPKAVLQPIQYRYENV